MGTTASELCRNRLLAALPDTDRAVLAPQLEYLTFERRHSMERPGEAIEYVYFPFSGIGSVVAVGHRKRDLLIETGIFGREGMSGTPLVLGVDRSAHDVYMQIDGDGVRLPARHLDEALARIPALRTLLLRYVHAARVQTSHTALTNGRNTLEVRLARWLVMAHDRIDGDAVMLTHEFLSLMLGVRRAGVTVGSHALEAKGLIRTVPGRLTILDRDGLIALADGAYGGPEAEYDRLIGRRD